MLDFPFSATAKCYRLLSFLIARLIGQKPSIFWLGCCDSRVPAEARTSYDELFAVRIMTVIWQIIAGHWSFSRRSFRPCELAAVHCKRGHAQELSIRSYTQRNIANTFSQKDGSALAALAYAVNHLGVSHVVVCGHYGCGGVIAAMESAKNVCARFIEAVLYGNLITYSLSRHLQRQAVELEADEGAEAIQQWLSPIRALAVAEARVKERSATSDSDASDATDALKRLVEKNVCAQVSNVASCSVIKNAWKAGKSVTVHGKQCYFPAPPYRNILTKCLLTRLGLRYCHGQDRRPQCRRR